LTSSSVILPSASLSTLWVNQRKEYFIKWFLLINAT
jgi:hypothetical protein